MPRRSILRTAAAAGLAAVGWQTAFRIPASASEDRPAAVECYRQAYRNWAGEIRADDVLTCAPSTAEQAVAIVNWAWSRGLRVRAVGMRHGWSPLTITNGGGQDCILIDLTRYMTAIDVTADTHGSIVNAQAGATLDALLAELETHGCGLAACPAPGDVSLGGVLAIDGHGTAIPVAGEQPVPGQTFGTLSNLVLELTAVVWDSTQNAYMARTFTRTDPEIGALLAHLGRTLVLSATLRVAPNQRLRCQSRTNIPPSTLFAPPESAGPESFAAFVESCGRVETIWFPYTESPWLKLWSVSPERPPTARETDTPYNYPFSDEVPTVASDLLDLIMNGETWLTPTYTATEAQIASTGLIATLSADLWGWAKNTQLYVRPTTLRETANGYAVLTRRENIQQIVSKTYSYLATTLADYQAEGRYPMNGPWEVRVSGLDDPADCLVPGAREPVLSAARPRPDRPFDVVVWMDVLTFPGTPDSVEFYAGFESFMRTEFDGTDAQLRPEWSKGWAYSAAGAWTDANFIHRFIPSTIQAGQPTDDGWNAALSVYDALDPHRVYGNAFLDGLMG